jgi:thymidylate kinase
MTPLLISIDGPDGSGKSTTSKILLNFLHEKFGDNQSVVLFKPTYFETCPEALLVKERLESSLDIRTYSKEHNDFYLEAMRLNYLNVIIPSLEQEKIVILDSSEIRALAFNIAKGEKAAISDTKDKIQNGFLTAGVYPDIRIILDGSVSALSKNLQTKKFLDKGDPVDLGGISKRRKSYSEAVKFVNNLNYNKRIDIYNLKIKHNLRAEEYLKDLVYSRMSFI